MSVDTSYAPLCGVVLPGAAGITFTPAIQRILQRFRIDDAGN